jgi:hypothetical protein
MQIPSITLQLLHFASLPFSQTVPAAAANLIRRGQSSQANWAARSPPGEAKTSPVTRSSSYFGAQADRSIGAGRAAALAPLLAAE